MPTTGNRPFRKIQPTPISNNCCLSSAIQCCREGSQRFCNDSRKRLFAWMVGPLARRGHLFTARQRAISTARQEQLLCTSGLAITKNVRATQWLFKRAVSTARYEQLL